VAAGKTDLASVGVAGENGLCTLSDERVQHTTVGGMGDPDGGDGVVWPLAAGIFFSQRLDHGGQAREVIKPVVGIAHTHKIQE
jgi:hypothetical protein